jgi:hypothetical protein
MGGVFFLTVCGVFHLKYNYVRKNKESIDKKRNNGGVASPCGF